MKETKVTYKSNETDDVRSIHEDEPKLTIFVSSVMNKKKEDLDNERVICKKTIQKIAPAHAWLFEYSPASPDNVNTAYLKKVEQCDIFICIIGSTITDPVKNECSIAELNNKPRIFVIKRTVDRKQDCTEFISTIKEKWQPFGTETQLKRILSTSLTDLIIRNFRKGAQISTLELGVSTTQLTDVEQIRKCAKQNVIEEIKTSIGPKFIQDLYVNRQEQLAIMSIIEKGSRGLREVKLQLIHEINDYVQSPGEKILDAGRKAACLRLLENENIFELSYHINSLFELPVTLHRTVKKIQGQLTGVILLIGQSGNGKTNIICQNAITAANKYPCVFINGATRLNNNHDLELLILKALGIEIDRNIDNYLSHITQLLSEKNTKILVFIDAINENPDYKMLLENLMHCIRSKYAFAFQFIISCRDVSWELYFCKSDLKDYISQEITLGYFNEKEFKEAINKYLNNYRIKVYLGKRALTRMHHPLLLKFFCEAYKNENEKFCDLGTIEDFSLKSVFDQYWANKLANIQNRLGPASLYQAEQMLLKMGQIMQETQNPQIRVKQILGNNNAQPQRDLIELFQLLRDEYIIIETTQQDYVRFVYDEFMAYIIGREIRNKLLEIPENKQADYVNFLLASAGNFGIIYEALGYGALFFESGNQIIWKALISNDETARETAAKSLYQFLIKSYSDLAFDTVSNLATRDPFISHIKEIIWAIEKWDEWKAFTIWRTVAIGGNVKCNEIIHWKSIFQNECQKVKTILLKNPITDVVINTLMAIGTSHWKTGHSMIHKLLKHEDELVRLFAGWVKDAIWYELSNDILTHTELQTDASLISLSLLLKSFNKERQPGTMSKTSFEKAMSIISTKISPENLLDILHIHSLEKNFASEEDITDICNLAISTNSKEDSQYFYDMVIPTKLGRLYIKTAASTYFKASHSSEDIVQSVSLESSTCAIDNNKEYLPNDNTWIDPEEKVTLWDVLSYGMDYEIISSMVDYERYLRNAITKNLTSREKKIIAMKYGLEGEYEHTSTEIGKKIKCSTNTVNKDIDKALRKLKQSSELNDLRDYYRE